MAALLDSGLKAMGLKTKKGRSKSSEKGLGRGAAQLVSLGLNDNESITTSLVGNRALRYRGGRPRSFSPTGRRNTADDDTPDDDPPDIDQLLSPADFTVRTRLNPSPENTDIDDEDDVPRMPTVQVTTKLTAMAEAAVTAAAARELLPPPPLVSTLPGIHSGRPTPVLVPNTNGNQASELQDEERQVTQSDADTDLDRSTRDAELQNHRLTTALTSRQHVSSRGRSANRLQHSEPEFAWDSYGFSDEEVPLSLPPLRNPRSKLPARPREHIPVSPDLSRVREEAYESPVTPTIMPAVCYVDQEDTKTQLSRERHLSMEGLRKHREKKETPVHSQVVHLPKRLLVNLTAKSTRPENMYSSAGEGMTTQDRAQVPKIDKLVRRQIPQSSTDSEGDYYHSGASYKKRTGTIPKSPSKRRDYRAQFLQLQKLLRRQKEENDSSEQSGSDDQVKQIIRSIKMAVEKTTKTDKAKNRHVTKTDDKGDSSDPDGSSSDEDSTADYQQGKKSKKNDREDNHKKDNDDKDEKKRRDKKDKSMKKTRKVIIETDTDDEKEEKKKKKKSTAMPFHGKTPDLTRFSNSASDSQTFGELVDVFQLHCFALSIPEENFARLLPMYFIENAMAVYSQVIKETPECVDDWELLKEKLGSRFQSRGQAIHTNTLFNKVRGKESIGAFFQNITSLAKQAFPKLDDDARDSIISSQFVRGLDQQLRYHLMNRGSMSSNKAYLVAERYETNRNLCVGGEIEATGTTNALSEREQDRLMENMKNSQRQLDIRERTKMDESIAKLEWNPQDPRFNNSRARYGNYSHTNNENHVNRGTEWRARPQQDNHRYEESRQSRNWNYGRHQMPRADDFYDRQPRQRPTYSTNGSTQPTYYGQQRALGYGTTANNQPEWRMNQWSNQAYNHQRGQAYGRRPFHGDYREQQARQTGPEPRQHYGNRYGWNGSPKCDNCGKSGHLAHACRFRNDRARFTNPGPIQNRAIEYENSGPTDKTVALIDEDGISRQTGNKETQHTYNRKTGKSVSTTIMGLMFFLSICMMFRGTEAIHSSPMICPKNQRTGSKSHMLLKMPTAQTCPKYRESNASIQNLTMTFYRQRSVRESERAMLCYREVVTVFSYLYFLKEERLHTKTVHYEVVSSEECKGMVENRRINGQKLYLQGGVIGSHTPVTVEYKWCCRWVKQVIVNYYVELGYLYLQRDSGKIRSSLGNLDKCHYLTGTCTIPNHGVVIWQPNKQETCQFTQWTTKSGEWHNGNWLAEDKTLALTYTDHRKRQYQLCDGEGKNVSVFLSDQGIYTHPHEKINDSYFQPLNTIAAMAKTDTSAHDLGMIEAVNVVAQSLSESIHQISSKIYFSALEALCTHNIMSIKMLRSVILLQPTLSLRELLGDAYLSAIVHNDDLVSVHSCIPVTEWKFMKEKGSKCRDKVPVTFRLQDTTGKGFLDPMTNIINSDSIERPCQKHETTILNINGSSIEYQWSTGKNITMTELPELLTHYFTLKNSYQPTPLSIYRLESGLMPVAELGSSNSLLDDFLQSMQNEREVLRRVGIVPEESVISTDGSLGKISGHSIFSWIKSGWFRFMTIWNIVINTIVSIVTGLIIVQTVRQSVKIRWARRSRHQPVAQNDPEIAVLRGYQVTPISSIDSENPSLQPPEFIDEITMENNPYKIPLIKVRISGDLADVSTTGQVTVLLDSGSYFNVLSRSLARKLKLKIEPTNHVPFDFGGNKVNLLGEATCMVDLCDRLFPLRFVVNSKEASRDIIIGYRGLWHLGNVTLCIKEGGIMIDGKFYELVAPRCSARVLSLQNQIKDTEQKVQNRDLKHGTDPTEEEERPLVTTAESTKSRQETRKDSSIGKYEKIKEKERPLMMRTESTQTRQKTGKDSSMTGNQKMKDRLKPLKTYAETTKTRQKTSKDENVFGNALGNTYIRKRGEPMNSVMTLVCLLLISMLIQGASAAISSSPKNQKVLSMLPMYEQADSSNQNLKLIMSCGKREVRKINSTHGNVYIEMLRNEKFRQVVKVSSLNATALRHDDSPTVLQSQYPVAGLKCVDKNECGCGNAILVLYDKSSGHVNESARRNHKAEATARGYSIRHQQTNYDHMSQRPEWLSHYLLLVNGHQSAPLSICRPEPSLMPAVDVGSNNGLSNAFLYPMQNESEALRRVSADVRKISERSIFSGTSPDWFKYIDFGTNTYVVTLVSLIVIRILRKYVCTDHNELNGCRAVTQDDSGRVIQRYPISANTNVYREMARPMFIGDITKENNPFTIPLIQAKVTKRPADIRNVRNVTVLLDSGSYFNVISRSMARTLQLEIEPTNFVPVDFGGNDVSLLGEATCWVELCNRLFPLRFVVSSDDATREIIIGYRGLWHLGSVTFCVREGSIVVDGRFYELVAPWCSARATTMHGQDDIMGQTDAVEHISSGVDADSMPWFADRESYLG